MRLFSLVRHGVFFRAQRLSEKSREKDALRRCPSFAKSATIFIPRTVPQEYGQVMKAFVAARSFHFLTHKLMNTTVSSMSNDLFDRCVYVIEGLLQFMEHRELLRQSAFLRGDKLICAGLISKE